MTTETLEPIDPKEAMEMYLDDCRGELSPNTVDAKEYRLGFFIRWCEGADNNDEPRIINLNKFSGRDVHKFKNWRKEGINKVTLRTQLSDLRSFMRFCVTINAVPSDLPEKIDVPILSNGENERDTFISVDKVRNILEYFGQYHYASLNHICALLAWQMGARTGALHSLDVDDIDWEENQIKVRHRPDQGTRLKNGNDGERIVTLESETMIALEDYVEDVRKDVQDDYGRNPLMTTRHGRMAKNNLSKRMYYITTPCQYGQECPGDRDPTSCEHATGFSPSVECPHNTRPHDIRRGSITHWLKSEVPETVISDRMNVSKKTLDRHYDKRTEQEKADQRRGYLEEV